MYTLGFNLGMPEILILAVLGLLIFGKRLPEVGRNLGKSIVEFKKGLSGVEKDVNDAVNKEPSHQPAPAPDPQEQLRLANERMKAMEAELAAARKQQSGSR